MLFASVPAFGAPKGLAVGPDEAGADVAGALVAGACDVLVADGRSPNRDAVVALAAALPPNKPPTVEVAAGTAEVVGVPEVPAKSPLAAVDVEAGAVDVAVVDFAAPPKRD